MTKYEDHFGLVSDEAAKKYFEEECDMGVVEDEGVALYVLRDGTMIGDPNDQEWGERGTDHRAAMGMISEGKDFYTGGDTERAWAALHAKTGMIRYVPESGEALIAEGQDLTDAQQEFVQETGASVDRYVKGLDKGQWLSREDIDEHMTSKEAKKIAHDKEEVKIHHLDDVALDQLVKSSYWQVRKQVADYSDRDQDFDQLVSDEEESVRRSVAYHGRDKDLDQLVNDGNHTVRVAVAGQGRDKDLDQLVSDPNPDVRRAVAEQGRDQDLDQLVSDADDYVRFAVAMEGRDKDLDQLVSDPYWLIRRHVAEVGREQDLAILVNDKDKDVRNAANSAQAKKLEEVRREKAQQLARQGLDR